MLSLHPAVMAPRSENMRGLFREFRDPNQRHVVVGGPLGTSKTMTILLFLHTLCMSQPDLRVAIARNEKATLYSTLIPSMAKMLRYGFRNTSRQPFHVWGGETRPQELAYYNGSRIVFTGFESDKFFGGEWSIIYVNELRLVDERPYADVAARLRGGGYYTPEGRETYLIVSDTNPSSHRSWIKQREADGRLLLLSTTLEDNPYYFQNGKYTEAGQLYYDDLRVNYTGFQFDRYVRGLWVGAEGLCFPMFSEEKHVRPFEFHDVPPSWKWTGSVDYGINHPCAFQLWATSPDRKRTWMFREIYRTGLTAHELGFKIQDMLTEYGLPKRTLIVGDSASDHNQTLRNQGLRVRDANKEVAYGVDVYKQWLNGVDEREIIFNANSLWHKEDPELRQKGKPTRTVEEFDGYVHLPEDKQTTGTERDDLPDQKRGGDDGIDSSRYHLVDIHTGRKILTAPKVYRSPQPRSFVGEGLLRP